MCLYAKTGEVKTATRNIVVTKYFRKPFVKGELKSTPRNFTYELGKEYSGNFSWANRVKPLDVNYRIERGFHACIRGKRKEGIHGIKYYAVIPKGAKYVIGDKNDIVSTAIIVRKKL